MFWGKKKDDNKLMKDRSIAELTAAFPSIRKPNNDDSLFEILFNVSGTYSTLRVYIPHDFPVSRPVIQVMGPATHPWLDQYKRVSNCQKLNEWSKTSSLVDIVQSILQALTSSSSGSPPLPSSGGYPAVPAASTSMPMPPPKPSSTPSNANANANTNASYPVQTPVAAPMPNPYASPLNANSSYPGSALGNPINRSASVNTLPNSNLSSVSVDSYANPARSASYNVGGLSSLSMDHYNIPVSQLPTTATGDAFKAPPPLTYPAPSTSNKSLSPAPTPTNNRGHPEKYPLPDAPQTFPELRGMSEAQLENLLSEPKAFKAFLQSFDDAVAMRQKREEIRKFNVELSSETLKKDLEAESIRGELRDLQATLKELASSYRHLMSQHATDYAVSRESILKKLCEKRDVLDSASEDIASSFVNGSSSSVETITKTYFENRKAYHSLNTRIEML